MHENVASNKPQRNFQARARVGGDISGGKKARSKIIFSNLTKVRALNKTVEIICLQHYSF